MTEFEIASLDIMKTEATMHWVELLQTQGGLTSEVATLFTTVLFGYLAVAFFVGRDLSTRHTLLLNGLYLAFQLGNLFTFAVAHAGGTTIWLESLEGEQIGKMNNAAINNLFWSYGNTTILSLFLCLMLVASLYFMWSVRHPKTGSPR